MGKAITLFLEKFLYPFKYLLTSVYYCKLIKQHHKIRKAFFFNPLIAYQSMIANYTHYTAKIVRIWI